MKLWNTSRRCTAPVIHLYVGILKCFRLLAITILIQIEYTSFQIHRLVCYSLIFLRSKVWRSKVTSIRHMCFYFAKKAFIGTHHILRLLSICSPLDQWLYHQEFRKNMGLIRYRLSQLSCPTGWTQLDGSLDAHHWCCSLFWNQHYNN